MSEDIKIGDWVRWDGVLADGTQSVRWAYGEVVRVESDSVRVRVESASDQWFAAIVHLIPRADNGTPIIRRIPRPCSDPIVKRTLDGNVVVEAVYRDPHPLDVMYDGVMLRTLLDGDAYNRHEHGRGLTYAKPLTTAQRAAVSAHWSAELRRKVSEAKERERCVVSYSEWEPGE